MINAVLLYLFIGVIYFIVCSCLHIIQDNINKAVDDNLTDDPELLYIYSVFVYIFLWPVIWYAILFNDKNE